MFARHATLDTSRERLAISAAVFGLGFDVERGRRTRLRR
jgi:hypothetical protein